MLIVSNDYDLDFIVKNRENSKAVIDYIRETMPDIYQHNNTLLSNTRYFINCQILERNDIEYSIKKEVSNVLCAEIKCGGVMGVFTPISIAEGFVNQDSIKRMFMEGTI